LYDEIAIKIPTPKVMIIGMAIPPLAAGQAMWQLKKIINT
jgi:hypothetical protein